MQQLNGTTNPQELPHPSTWRLHLKHTTPLDMTAVKNLVTTTSRSQEFLSEACSFLTPERFFNLFTSRTIKATSLSEEDVERAVQMGKFEPCDPEVFKGVKLPRDAHGVNLFAVPELKGRRRMITEPHLNSAIPKGDVPSLEYATRLGKRQSLRRKKYMIQLDFEAYYDSITMPESIRNNFVFRSKAGKYYRLCTLPTGARWSVAVGQAVTNVIIDIDTPVTIHTIIDNIMIAADSGEEKAFLHAVRTILQRIKQANLLTSPDREDMLRKDDAELLAMAQEANTFLGEEFSAWNGTERLVRNSTKTIAKLMLALKIQQHTHRTFASLVSLILFALHTTQMNPAKAFHLLRAYRGVYHSATVLLEWDAPLAYMESRVRQELDSIGNELCENKWWRIAEERHPTYNEHDYDYVVFTDASAAGWGAVVQNVKTLVVKTYQQRWIADMLPLRGASPTGSTKLKFNARHSAHAEPRGAQLILQQLVKEGLQADAKVAFVTDHYPIAHAQKQLNGYGGIGRGYALNKLYEYTYDLLYKHNIQVSFFYLMGRLNPADELSRHFGGAPNDRNITVRRADDIGLPPLKDTRSPLCDETEFGRVRPIYRNEEGVDE